VTDPFTVAGLHVLVTGASSGLGAFFARTLAARGAVVTLAARRGDTLEREVAHIVAGGGRAHAVVLDVTGENSVRAAFDAAEANAGPVQVLINNAGIAMTRKALDIGPDEFDAVLDTNLRGAWLVARECASRLVAAGRGGSVVNIASILALRVAGQVMPYAVSKAALVQMTKALALEWARHGIRVNAIAPGYVETELNAPFLASEPGQAMLDRVPMRRAGRPEELTGALLLLASDAGSFMTGSVITVDGGHLVGSL
jgi:NAD(P)-dependent dehydrogenase (short-subunit alcohol dehydrogenase family)